MRETKREILQRIGQESTWGYNLADELDLTPQTVYSHLDDLEEAEYIEQSGEESGRTIFSLTEKGKSEIE
ncbi:helix-turn-helix transcriptional regulator [Halobacterium litoreum]|uniref:Helix-turn-helix transcriptional regulator n=1 Tax=Halobacterium litoreum TaxID=2039234 RepID=A0ABD5NFS4_9EURY|nr:helix-turn-helix transcriptional regulator [Halobacterium litoreum]UHH13201.1 helix-turn-helix transcriptional regulator [Halobacterium litoreum]